MKDTSVKWKKYIDILTVVFLFLTASAAIAGGIVGSLALKHYWNASNSQMTSMLFAMDSETSRSMLEKPYLHAIYATHTRNNNDIKLSSIKLLELLLVKGKRDTICQNWKDIPELYDKLFESDANNITNVNRQRLRNAYFVMDNILYTISNAYEAKRNHAIKDDDYKTYLGYFSEVGHNPLFLCSVYCAHQHGYITKRFAKEIHIQLKNRHKFTIDAIYPDLLSPTWVQRCGKTID